MNTAQAKQIQIAGYLQTLGIKPSIIKGDNYWYRSPFREEQSASFKVDTAKNIWYDHGAGEGSNILDLVMRMQNTRSIETALAHLSRQSISTKQIVHSSFNSNTTMKEQNPAMTIQNIIPITHPRLIEWVRERKIDLNLANRYCREIHYQTNGKNCFSVGFRNDNGGYELSSPPNFKSCIAPKDITTIRNASNICLVFEGFWDFLSYLAIQKIEKSKHDIAVLNSVANVQKAMDFLKSHQTIYTYLDNDEAGQKATKLIQSVHPTVYNRSAKYAEYKDLNDYLRGKKLLPQKQVRKGFKL
jgi:hypothetical protein